MEGKKFSSISMGMNIIKICVDSENQNEFTLKSVLEELVKLNVDCDTHLADKETLATYCIKKGKI